MDEFEYERYMDYVGGGARRRIIFLYVRLVRVNDNTIRIIFEKCIIRANHGELFETTLLKEIYGQHHHTPSKQNMTVYFCLAVCIRARISEQSF